MKTISPNCDRSYKSNIDFEDIVDVIKLFAQNDKNGKIERQLSDVYVIHINEGVFIRTKNCAWRDALDLLCMQEGKNRLCEIEDSEWQNVTRKYRHPVESFGGAADLAIWRASFMK
jgi:hypothetical protein